MRWSIGRFSSPRQYAPATFSSLNAGIRPVDSTCGPAHRSSNFPCLYVVIFSSSGISSMISIFRGSEAFMRSASSRGYSWYSNVWFCWTTRRIRFSIRDRSCSENGSSTMKS